MTVLDQPPEMLLERIATGAGEPDHVANRDAAGLASALEDAGGQLRQRGDRELFPFDFGGEAPLLLLKGASVGLLASSSSRSTALRQSRSLRRVS